MSHLATSVNGTARLLERIPELAPFDEHNRTLLANTHPPDWQNPRPSGRYNLVVVGAGTAGLVAAAGAAGLGAKVALVERRLMGGDCLNVGCVPSKALIRCARAAADIGRAADFGVGIAGDVWVDFPTVMERMRRLRARISPHDSAERFRRLGIDVFLGEAGFIDGRRLRVGETTLEFARAVIATGGRPTAPPVPGLAEGSFLTNETVFSLTELPPRLAVLGAGPIGCEIAQSFARFGSEVTLIEATPRILPREEPRAAAVVEAALRRDGVRIVCGGRASSVEATGADKTIHLECDAQSHQVAVDAILVAVGRAPNVQGLNLVAAGVEFDPAKGVAVNDFLQTTNPRIYAAGDVCSAFKFTHAADAMARIVIQNALFFGRARVGALNIPWCTYTDPEVAHVGLYPHEADQRGLRSEALTVEFSTVDRAILDGDEDGFLEVLLKRGTDRILGATVVGRHAGDLISAVTLAMTGGLGLRVFARTIHPYPTHAEIMKKAGDALNRTRLTPRVKALFRRLLAWRR